MKPKTEPPRLYSQLADWFHLLTAPSSYLEEAEFVRKILTTFGAPPVESVLELGSGGGNNASHLKATFRMTLTDLSTAMLDQSRQINPDCEHVQGDMRSIRLGREFDAVFVHDAVCYLTSREDVIACLETAFVHCKPGGVVLVMPDYVRERFRPGVHHGGHDGDGRSLRYFEWTFDPDPSDRAYTVDFVYMLRDENEPVRVEHETHLMGLFSHDEWMECLDSAGFDPKMLEDPYKREVFVGVREGGSLEIGSGNCPWTGRAVQIEATLRKYRWRLPSSAEEGWMRDQEKVAQPPQLAQTG